MARKDLAASQTGRSHGRAAPPRINARELDAGKHVVLAPGIFELDAPLRLTHADQVLLGLGLATLHAVAGTAAITVSDVDGVRVAGLMIEAGEMRADALVVWGSGAHAGDAKNPGVLSDIFVRVGGPYAAETSALTMVHVRSGHVIGGASSTSSSSSALPPTVSLPIQKRPSRDAPVSLHSFSSCALVVSSCFARLPPNSRKTTSGSGAPTTT